MAVFGPARFGAAAVPITSVAVPPRAPRDRLALKLRSPALLLGFASSFGGPYRSWRSSAVIFRAGGATTRRAASVESSAAETRLDIEAMTVAQLKEECRARGLTVSGNKSDLQARLRGAAAPPPAEPRRVMTVEQLKDECRTRGLAVSGTKADLEARLRGEDPPPPAAPDGPYGGLTATQLKEALKERGLPVTGKKAELIAKLVANDKEKLMPELEEKSHKERLDGNGGKAGPKKDPNLPLLLSSKERSTKNMSKVQLRALERQAAEKEALLQGSGTSSQDPDGEGEAAPPVIVSKAPLKGARRAQSAAKGGMADRSGPVIQASTSIAHYLLDLLDTADEVVVAYNLREKMAASALTVAGQDTSLVEARVMTKKMRVLDPKTGKITSKAVRYPHGGLRISCYMTDELFKHLGSMGVRWRHPKGDTAWQPGATKGMLPRPLSEDEYAESQEFLKQKEIESIGDALDIEGRMDLMDMGLARKSALVAGRISKTASKRGMRREQAEALGPEGEQSNAPATEPRGRREDYGAGNSRWGRERTDERWAPRERGREDGERGSWRSDRNDNFQGRQERATGRGRGRSNQQGPAKGRRSQFSDRDEMRYNEKNSWGRNAEFGGGSQWYDGSGGWESTRRKGKSDAGEENFRMNGLTDDGRSTWVSHGNTWSKWDDDGWGDEGKVKDQGRKGQGNGGRIQDGKEDQEWVAGLGGWDADKAWIDSPAVDTKVSRQDLLDDWLDDDYTSTPSSKSARGSAASASLDDEQRDGPMAAGSKKSRNIWDDGLDLPLTQEDDLSWDSFGGKDDNKRYGATNSMVGALDEQERGAKRGKRGDSRGFTSPAERGMLNVGRDDDDVDPFAWGSSDEDTEVGRWLDDLDAPEVVAKPSSRNTAKAGRGTRKSRAENFEESAAPTELEGGVKVDIVSGPFRDFTGKVIQKKRNGMVQVNLDMFGLDTDVEVGEDECRVQP